MAALKVMTFCCILYLKGTQNIVTGLKKIGKKRMSKNWESLQNVYLPIGFSHVVQRPVLGIAFFFTLEPPRSAKLAQLLLLSVQPCQAIKFPTLLSPTSGLRWSWFGGCLITCSPASLALLPVSQGQLATALPGSWQVWLRDLISN